MWNHCGRLVAARLLLLVFVESRIFQSSGEAPEATVMRSHTAKDPVSPAHLRSSKERGGELTRQKDTTTALPQLNEQQPKVWSAITQQHFGLDEKLIEMAKALAKKALDTAGDDESLQRERRDLLGKVRDLQITPEMACPHARRHF